jgi:hypothetical protein
MGSASSSLRHTIDDLDLFNHTYDEGQRALSATKSFCHQHHNSNTHLTDAIIKGRSLLFIHQNITKQWKMIDESYSKQQPAVPSSHMDQSVPPNTIMDDDISIMAQRAQVMGTWMQLAIQAGHINVIRLLLEMRASPVGYGTSCSYHHNRVLRSLPQPYVPNRKFGLGGPHGAHRWLLENTDGTPMYAPWRYHSCVHIHDESRSVSHTPLYDATRLGYSGVVRLLVAVGASPTQLQPTWWPLKIGSSSSSTSSFSFSTSLIPSTRVRQEEWEILNPVAVAIEYLDSHRALDMLRTFLSVDPSCLLWPNRVADAVTIVSSMSSCYILHDISKRSDDDNERFGELNPLIRFNDSLPTPLHVSVTTIARDYDVLQWLVSHMAGEPISHHQIVPHGVIIPISGDVNQKASFVASTEISPLGIALLRRKIVVFGAGSGSFKSSMTYAKIIGLLVSIGGDLRESDGDDQSSEFLSDQLQSGLQLLEERRLRWHRQLTLIFDIILPSPLIDIITRYRL